MKTYHFFLSLAFFSLALFAASCSKDDLVSIDEPLQALEQSKAIDNHAEVERILPANPDDLSMKAENVDDIEVVAEHNKGKRLRQADESVFDIKSKADLGKNKGKKFPLEPKLRKFRALDNGEPQAQ